MFNSNKFKYTRDHGYEPGMNVDIMNLINSREVTNMYEPEDLLYEYNRETLKDRNCLPPAFEHEFPRRDTGAKWHLNLRHDGVWGSTELPYVHNSMNGGSMGDDCDISFKDLDPRRWVPEPRLNGLIDISKPRLSQTFWGKDSDYSIPEHGITPQDILSRIVEARRRLKERLQWFDESLGCIVAGRTTNSQNNPSEVGLITLTDKSAAIDPSMFDSVSTQNLNRILSNNLHMGGKYFIERTTTDHVVPIASYNFLFRSGNTNDYKIHKLESDTLAPIKTLNMQERARNFLLFLESYDTKSKVSREKSITNGLNIENKNISGPDLNKDILALLGLTYADIKWLNSRENINRAGVKECIANVVEMVEVLEKLPPNALLDIRNSILREHAKEFQGGMGDSVLNHKICDILESRTGVKGVQKSKLSDIIGTDYNIAETSVYTPRNSICNQNKNTPQGKYKKIPVDMQKMPVANYINVNKQVIARGNNTPKEQTSHIINDLINFNKSNGVKKNILSFLNKRPESSHDTNFGQELYTNHELKSYNDSHLIPKQFKR